MAKRSRNKLKSRLLSLSSYRLYPFILLLFFEVHLLLTLRVQTDGFVHIMRSQTTQTEEKALEWGGSIAQNPSPTSEVLVADGEVLGPNDFVVDVEEKNADKTIGEVIDVRFSLRSKLACVADDAKLCVAVYVSISSVNARRVLDLDCPSHSSWIPLLLRTFETDGVDVAWICTAYENMGDNDSPEKKRESIQFKWDQDDEIPQNVDMIVAFDSFREASLITVINFIARVERSSVEFLLSETYPNYSSTPNTVPGSALKIDFQGPPLDIPSVEMLFDGSRSTANPSLVDNKQFILFSVTDAAWVLSKSEEICNLQLSDSRQCTEQVDMRRRYFIPHPFASTTATT